MAKGNLIDRLEISETALNCKCKNCIMGRQTRCPFNGEFEKDLMPLELISFDIWGPSYVQSAGGKVYLMVVVDAGTSYKHSTYLADKSDTTVMAGFDAFRVRSKTLTNKKVCRIRTDGAFNSPSWKDYYQCHGFTHEITAPYSSAQNGLAE